MKQFAEFFAGIGLVRAGLAPGGWHCAFANDIDPKKQKMYSDHFGPSPEYHLGDIRDTETMIAKLPADLKLATASFPCTDLSLAGHWRGIDGEHSSTFFAFTQILEVMGHSRPPLILIENVLGFAKSNGGRDFARACAELSSKGYWLDTFVLDAKWFVPQSRPRIFIVAVQEPLSGHSIFEKSEGLFGDSSTGFSGEGDLFRPASLREVMALCSRNTHWLHTRLPKPPRRSVQLQAVLDVSDSQEWWTAAEVQKHLLLMQPPSTRRLDQLRDGDQYTVGTGFRRTRLGKPRTETRFDIAGCLRTPRGGSARQIVIRAGRGRVDLRWMTAKEYASLQGIPDFNIQVPTQQALFGFGDAVCVPAVRWIDRHILSPLADNMNDPQSKTRPLVETHPLPSLV